MKSILMKLLVLAVCAAMLLSLFACDGGNKETEAPTDEKTEAPADDKTEAPTQKETEAPTQKETEAPTQGTEAPTQGTEAPTTGESTPAESTPAESTPAESTPAESTPAESTPGESTPAESTPAESTPAESTPTETEAKPEDKPTETEAKPEDKPTETEAKPEDKPTETEAKPEDKPTETKPEEKPTETEAPKETETEGPKCDGNHPIKAKGDQGHYVDKCDICGTERGNIEDHTYETVDGKPTCKVCGYVASCNGVHAWQSDENGHWTEKCNACDAPATESAAHEMAHNEAGEYRCTVCQYLVTCDKNHALTDKGAEGHEVAACIICNTEAVTVPHVYEDKDGSRFCACGNEAACKGQHNWQSDADGHWADACDVCGAAAVAKTAHDAENSEFMTADAYNYGCATCGYAVYTKAITEGVKAFFEAGLFNKAETFYNLGAHEFIYDTETYSRYNGNDAVAQVLWQRAHEDMVWSQFASEGQQKKVDIGNAKYLVMKIRTNANAEIFNLQFSTTGTNSPIGVATQQMVAKKNGEDFVVAEIGEEYRTSAGYSGIILPLSATENGEWATYVIDLEKAFPTQMVKDAETGTYIVDTFYFHFNSIAATTNFDIAYAAFVEGEWDAVDAFVEEETVVKVAGSNTGSVVYTETAKCVGDHAYETVVVDGYYKTACSCGDVKFNYGIKADGPNKFFGAEKLSGTKGFTGSMDVDLTYEEDAAFVRISNPVVNKDNWYGWNLVQWENGNFGQYMIIKVRIGENGLGQTFLQIYTNSVGGKNAGITWDKGNLKFKVSEDNQWHYIVIDLAACVPNNAFQADANGNYAPDCVQLRPFCNNQKGAQADDYMDISYIAFCDSMDDIKNIVDVDTYEWSVNENTSSQRYTEDNTCVTHAIKEKVEGELHTVFCSVCEETLNTFSIPAAVNWYSSLSNMGKLQHALSLNLYDEVEGVMFNRYTGTGGNHLNLTTTQGGAGAPTTAAFASGKYVAIKYRATNTTLGLNVATYAPDFAYVDQRGKSAGTQAIANLPGDEWRVAIVDVSGVAGWVSDGSQQRFYIMITTSGSQPYTVDIAWVAVVDSIDEMKLLLNEGETYYDYGTNFANAGVHYDQEGNKVPCTVHPVPVLAVTDGENGAKVYTYTCPACDSKLYTREVPAGAVYMGPDILGTVKPATVINPDNLPANDPAITATKDNFHPGNHFAMTNAGTRFEGVPYFGFNGTSAEHKTVIFIWNRAYADYTTNAPSSDRYLLDMGEAKYLIIKARTSLAHTNPDAFTVQISTDSDQKNSASIAIPAKATQGDWVTYVIDLATVAPTAWQVDEETGHYIMDTFYLNFYNCLTTDSVDLAYIAFAPEWADVDAIVEEETVINITATNGTYEEVYTVDGTLLGTKAEDPISVMFDENMSASVTVPANTTFYFSSWSLSDGMILKANGEELEFVAGSMMLRTPSTFSITNSTDAPVTYALTVEFAEGTFENPAELVKGDNVIEFAEGAQNYYLTWTATESGKITLTFSANTGWFYAVHRTYNGSYPDMFDTDGDGDTEELIYDRITSHGDGQWSDSDPVVNTVVIEVEEGDVISIEVCTYDPENPWAAPAGTVTVNAEWGNDDSYVLTIEEAIELGLAQAHNTYTDEKYYVTGVIARITSATSYGNLYIVDENGTEFCIYGSYNEDGSVQYGSMTVKPVVGDTVTVYGPVGQYSGTAQIKNGWIMSFVSHTCNFSAADCENDSACTICGAKGTEAALGHIDEDPADGICDRCEADLNAEATELVITAAKLGLGAYKAGTAEIDGIEFAFTELGDFGNGIQMRIKDGNTASLGNIMPTEKKIARIELVYNSEKSTYDNDDAFTFTFGTEENETAYTTTLDTVKGTKTYTVTPDTEDYTIFTMTLNLSYSFYWDSITIVYAD